ncbi:MAG: hypothetical protein A2Y40_06235 [Candidatus Margulisbacteria bacterium GWF2_35_9]|nr:MAG: hypothetical protein A2Y40_06235 [Candidatus Margulisbacteria bacterium GWF2_35_9]
MLFETIKLLNGEICNETFHQERVNYSRKENYGYEDVLNLSQFINNIPSIGVYRAKVIYEKTVNDVLISPYIEKPIKSLKVVHSSVFYPYKFLNREELDLLYTQREDADDVLIIKDGLITDTTIANSIFFDGETWYTPKEPLLKGTYRAKLLKEGVVKEKTIHYEEINNFKIIGIINALRGICPIDGIIG